MAKIKNDDGATRRLLPGSAGVAGQPLIHAPDAASVPEKTRTRAKSLPPLLLKKLPHRLGDLLRPARLVAGLHKRHLAVRPHDHRMRDALLAHPLTGIQRHLELPAADSK